MADGEVAVLVCTTIIETGIDIPNVNTIIGDADGWARRSRIQIRPQWGAPLPAYAYL